MGLESLYGSLLGGGGGYKSSAAADTSVASPFVNNADFVFGQGSVTAPDSGANASASVVPTVSANPSMTAAPTSTSTFLLIGAVAILIAVLLLKK